MIARDIIYFYNRETENPHIFIVPADACGLPVLRC
jgi:hypothetical protein